MTPQPPELPTRHTVGDHECTLILDTNQFVSPGFSYKDVRWSNLIRYLQKTGASVQMPEIIWQEIAFHFKKDLSALRQSIDSELDKLNKKLDFHVDAPLNFYGTNHQSRVTHSTEPLDRITEGYLAHIKEKLKLRAKDFILPKKEWFEIVIQRSIDHVPPFAANGDKGFKDTLIWLTILDLAERKGFKDHPIIFITKNTRDFCGTSEEKLHPTLLEEAESRGLRVILYTSLDRFFEKWASHALDINFKSVEKEIDLKRLTRELTNRLFALKRRLREIPLKVEIDGLNLVVRKASHQEREIDMSVSGYATSVDAPTSSYIEFTAEATQREAKGKKELTVTDFRLIANPFQ